MSPAKTLISAGQKIQEMRTQMERVEDVMQYPSDPNVVYSVNTEESKKKLKGGVELKNVSFGYSRLGEPLIRDFSMTMKPASRVAFVGTSGCGKSTLSKLISGLYEPRAGEILFDGKPRTEHDRAIMTGSIAVADQDTLDEAWEAAEVAGIADDIRAMPMGMQTLISEGQGGISGGRSRG